MVSLGLVCASDGRELEAATAPAPSAAFVTNVLLVVAMMYTSLRVSALRTEF